MDKLVLFLSSGILLSGIIFPFIIEAVLKIIGEAEVKKEILALLVSIILAIVIVFIYTAFNIKMFEGYTTYQFVVAVATFILLCSICSQVGYDKIYKALFDKGKISS